MTRIDLSLELAEPLAEVALFAIADNLRRVATEIENSRALEGHLFDTHNNKSARFEISVSQPDAASRLVETLAADL